MNLPLNTALSPTDDLASNNSAHAVVMTRQLCPAVGVVCRSSFIAVFKDKRMA